MHAALIVFPHQLFSSNLQLAKGKRTFLVEDELYFRQYLFHKKKLVMHRASMRAHADYLKKKGREVSYLECQACADMPDLVAHLKAAQVGEVHYIDPVDDWLEQRLLAATTARDLRTVRHGTPMFLTDPSQFESLFKGRKRYSMASFYAWQRQRMGVLMEHGQPVGGQWSFDTMNRRRLPKRLLLPPPWQPPITTYVSEAQDYVRNLFPTNPGTVEDFSYAVTYAQATQWLDNFLSERFRLFGDYEDAIAERESLLFHSGLSHLLNIGLLTPEDVLQRTLEFARTEQIELNSLEGFVRQLIGWREYVRAVYVLRGRHQRTRNFWNHQRPLPSAIYQASTGIQPVDAVIRRVLKHAYAHHIERLMVLANFMQLCEFDPNAVYQWFMELFIDAYDWVMVPNVYGMALFADGGAITTKPYISGSNYVLKMSDFKRGDWCAVWDSLFWSFLFKHREFLSRNPRLNLLVSRFDSMPGSQLAQYQQTATAFIESLN